MASTDWGAGDIRYLATHYTLKGLQNLVRDCDSQVAACFCVGDDVEAAYYAGLGACAIKAWELRREAEAELAAKQKPPPAVRRNGIEADDLKGRLSIADVVAEYVPLKLSGGKYYGRCPFHDDKSPSLVIYPDSQKFHCFGCQKHGDVIDFVMAMNGITFQQSLELLSKGGDLI